MRKIALLSAASAVAMMATPALAFDGVHWTWNANLDQYTTIDISHLTMFVDPGWTQVERLQVNAGNILAVTNQNYSAAYEPTAGSMPIYINVNQNFNQAIYQENEGQYGANTNVNGYNRPYGGNGNTYQSVDQLQANLAAQAINAPVYITVDMGNYVPHTLDATTDLGKITGSATAMANLASLTSDVGASFHDAQIAFGDFTKLSGDSLYGSGGQLLETVAGLAGDMIPSGNRGTDALAIASLEAQFGLIKKGNVGAYATADYVTNLAVQEDATAFGNLHSVSNTPTVAATRDYYSNVVYSPSVVYGDLTQFNYNNITAVASSANQQIYGFSNLGKINGSVSALTATAMGNMSSIVNKVSN
ncbi:MAG: hypothetical protein ACM31L_17860 [Actinomycetota bacterium]